MDSWRRWRSENHDQDGATMRARNGKPPRGNWQPTVPAWEKKFCWEVGRVPWKKLLETKKLIHTYENMLKWDDSAAEEAFRNAKNRYWARINGLPCNIPLPDPDAHIDNVDWNSDINPELILDLDRDFVVPDDYNKGERVLILGEMYALSQGLTPDGWGDEEDGNVKLTKSYVEKLCRPPDVWVDHGRQCDAGGEWEESKVKENDDVGKNGWESKAKEDGDAGQKGWDSKAEENGGHGGQWDAEDAWEGRVEENGDTGGNGWESKAEENGDVGENGWNCDSGWKQWESKVNKFGNHWEDGGYNSNYKVSNGGNMSRYKTTRFHGDGNMNNHWESINDSGYKSGNYNDWNNNGDYRENYGRHVLGYKTTRFYGNNQQNDQGERIYQNGRTKENLVRDQRPCRPINHHGAAGQGNNWGM